MSDGDFQQGKELINSKYEKSDIDMIEKLKSISPDFYNILVEFVFGKVWTRKILNTQSQEIVAITALITMGCVPELLKGHFHTALNSGLTSEEVKEIILLASIYIGIPKSINAFFVLQSVLDERAKK